MKTNKHIVHIVAFLFLFVSITPFFTNAYTPGDLIVCNGPNCDFYSLVKLVKVGITVLVEVSTLIAVVALIYNAFNLLMSGSNTKARGDIKKSITSIVIGYGFIVLAWLLVYTIASTLLKPSFNTILSP